MDLRSQHMFNESQTSNVPMNSSIGMVNGNGNNNTSSASSTNGANGGGSQVTGAASTTAAVPSMRANIDEQMTHNKSNDPNNRKRTKSKISPQNPNHHYMHNQSSGGQSSSTYPPNLDEWLNNSSNGTAASLVYQRNLDEWLNATIKEPPKPPFLTSSSEFLDTNRTAAINGINSANTAMATAFRLVPELQSSFPYGATNEPSSYFNVPGYPSHGLKLPHHSADFTSLPPGVNLNHENNRSGSQNDLLDGLEARRFSDPCLANNSDEEGAQQPATDKLNLKNQSDNNKLLATLIQQINYLHETNSKICRNLNDTKVDIEALKHAPSWGLRHRRDSVSGFSTHSQPMGYAFGTHSPAPTYHSGMYTPGMMTDVVREVKEAARVREEALLSRVRSMVEERSWTMNEIHLKMIRDLEELKVQMNQLKTERVETKNHVTKLEDEIKSLRSLLSHTLNFGRTNPVITPSNSFSTDRNFMRQTSNLRNTNGDRQKRHSFSLNYGTINQDDGGLNGPLFHSETDILQPMQEQLNELIKGEKLKYGINGAATDDTHSKNKLQNGHYPSDDGVVNDLQLLQMEKDNLELRRELQDAIANKKHADNKIHALESLVKNLQTKIPPDQNNVITITTHSSSRNSSVSENKTSPSIQPQVATPIQTIAPAKPTNNGTSTINLSGPVTDL